MKLKHLTVVHIFESPSSEDRTRDKQEGHALGEMLRLSGIEFEYYDIQNLRDFEISFETLITNVQNKQTDYGSVSLHISMHGNEDGIRLTSEEFISWDMFAQELIKVGNVLGYRKPLPNLDVLPFGLHFSSCDGLSAHKINNYVDINTSLFTHVVGPNKPVAWEDSLIAFTTYYHNHLNHNAKVNNAVDKMNIASNQIETFEFRLGKKMITIT